MDVDTQRPQGYAGVPQGCAGVQLCGPVEVGAEVQMDSQGKHCSMPAEFSELRTRHARSVSSSNNSICVAHGEDDVFAPSAEHTPDVIMHMRDTAQGDAPWTPPPCAGSGVGKTELGTNCVTVCPHGTNCPHFGGMPGDPHATEVGKGGPHATEVRKDAYAREAAGGNTKRSWCAQFFRPGRTRSMSLLMTITCFLFMDQNLMAPNLSDIGRHFNMTDIERDTKLGGEISLSLFIVGAPAAVIVGFYADRVNRKNLYTAVIFFGEVGCLLTYWVEEYWQLFFLRALTGIALGGSGPLVASMIGDMYPPEERPRAYVFAGLATHAGIGIGQLFASSQVGKHRWRIPFVVVAAPCLLFLLIFYYCVEEPTRGAQESTQTQMSSRETAERENGDNTHLKGNLKRSDPPRASEVLASEIRAYNPRCMEEGAVGMDEAKRGALAFEQPRTTEQRAPATPAMQASRAALQDPTPNLLRKATTCTWDLSGIWDFIHLFSIKSNVILFVQGICGCMPWGVINVYLNDYLVEDRKSHAKSLSPKLAGFAVCGAFGLGTLAGSILGGEVGRRIYLWKKHWIGYFLGICQILAIGPLLLILNLPFQLETLVPIAFGGGIISFITSPNVKALLLNVNTPNTRGTASAMFTLADDVGKGLGPPCIALLIKAYGRQRAFSITFFMWFLSGSVLMLLRFTLVADECRIKDIIGAEQLRLRMDAEAVEAKGTVVQGENVDSTDKTPDVICASEQKNDP